MFDTVQHASAARDVLVGAGWSVTLPRPVVGLFLPPGSEDVVRTAFVVRQISGRQVRDAREDRRLTKDYPPPSPLHLTFLGLV